MRTRAASSKPTIRDVAAEAGVSIATVSRALNGRAPIASETAKKVQAAVQALGFRANRTGRELRAGISRTVGVLVPSVADADRSVTLDGLDREGMPYVLVYNQPERTDRATATIDNIAAG